MADKRLGRFVCIGLAATDLTVAPLYE